MGEPEALVTAIDLLKRAALAAVWCSAAAQAGAQAWPSQPLRIVVPFAAGSVADHVARKTAEQMAALGQPVVIDNRPGANGIIGTDLAAKSRPDGHTVLLAPVAVLAINPAVYAKLPYQPQRDFTPVTLAARGYPLLLVPQSSPVRTLAELVADAKARPGRLSYGSPGVGSPEHLAMEEFEQRTGSFAVHIPYKIAGDAIADLIAGRLDALIAYSPVAVPHVQSGKLRALAVVGGDQRKPVLPDVPTAAELGMAWFDAAGWNAFVVPAGTPPEVVARLNRELTGALRSAAFRDWLAPFGSEAMPSTPAETASYIAAETERYARIVKASGVRGE
jgi:tripartite-type tricarboxylate transporter receptor subunit TctC